MGGSGENCSGCGNGIGSIDAELERKGMGFDLGGSCGVGNLWGWGGVGKNERGPGRPAGPGLAMSFHRAAVERVPALCSVPTRTSARCLGASGCFLPALAPWLRTRCVTVGARAPCGLHADAMPKAASLARQSKGVAALCTPLALQMHSPPRYATNRWPPSALGSIVCAWKRGPSRALCPSA